MGSRRCLAVLALAGGATAFVIAFTGSFLASVGAGMLVVATSVVILRDRTADEPDDSRRRFLRWGVGGLAFAFAGGASVLGAALKRVTRPDPRPKLEAAARGIGSEYLELVTRAYHPGRSGDLQLLVTPYSTSNYPQESRALLPDDPRSSHAVVWMYGQRVPIVVWSPGLVEPLDSVDRVTLADLAPSTAKLMGFDEYEAADGVPLPGLPSVTPSDRKSVV